MPRLLHGCPTTLLWQLPKHSQLLPVRALAAPDESKLGQPRLGTVKRVDQARRTSELIAGFLVCGGVGREVATPFVIG